MLHLRGHWSFAISIHALREESDHIPYLAGANKCTFQSTLSVRRATWREHPILGALYISIHALREESDTAHVATIKIANNFNPRSP